jgi:hypothetical protein
MSPSVPGIPSRLQVRGCNRRVDLLPRTRAISFASAGHRGPAFSQMSLRISNSPATGFMAGRRIGRGIDAATRRAVINTRNGPDAPRVDLEVHAGRAFGVR